MARSKSKPAQKAGNNTANRTTNGPKAQGGLVGPSNEYSEGLELNSAPSSRPKGRQEPTDNEKTMSTTMFPPSRTYPSVVAALCHHKKPKPVELRIDDGPYIETPSMRRLISAIANAIEADGRQSPLVASGGANSKHTIQAGSKLVYVNLSQEKLASMVDECITALEKPVEVVLALPGSEANVSVKCDPAAPPPSGVQNLDSDPAWANDPVWTKPGSEITREDLTWIIARRRLFGPYLVRDGITIGRLRNHLARKKEDWAWLMNETGYGRSRVYQFGSLASVVDGTDDLVSYGLPVVAGVGTIPPHWLEIGIDKAIDEVVDKRKEAKAAATSDDEGSADDETLNPAFLEQKKKAEERAARSRTAEAFGNRDHWTTIATDVKSSASEFPAITGPAGQGLVEAGLDVLSLLGVEDRRSVLSEIKSMVEDALAALTADAKAAK